MGFCRYFLTEVALICTVVLISSAQQSDCFIYKMIVCVYIYIYLIYKVCICIYTYISFSDSFPF